MRVENEETVGDALDDVGEPLGGEPQRLLRAQQLLLDAVAREQDRTRILECDRAQNPIFVVFAFRHQPLPRISVASSVPSTRERILAKAVSRLVETSSLNGE